MKACMGAAAAALCAALAVGACDSGKAPGSPEARKAAPAKGRPEFVRGPSGGAAIAPFVAAEVKAARTSGRGVLVYVGATWCEPCERFHRAAKAGELDALLGGLRLLEFDLDADRTALEGAGYASRLIPLFAVPNDDGTASPRRIEGSVKGEAAVKNDLAPRLAQLLTAH
jgi:hypothetical protein